MHFTVMLFGHCNAPATFERLMETVLRGPTYESCLVYLEDVIVIGCTFQEHLHNLQNMFQLFRESHLLWYLGHTVLPEGATTLPEKLKAAARGTSRKQGAPWPYAPITGGSSPVSPTL
jgi:hypothetical protein